MSSLFLSLHHLLVSHPSISSFTWSPDHTPFSSLPFLITTFVFYLSLTLLLHRLNIHLPPTLFRLLSSLHNLFLLLLSLTLALATCLSTLLHPTSYLFCFPPSLAPSGPLFFWAYIYYLSKVYELIDTVLILLNPRRPALTFLHVYHHSLVLVMSYLWIAERQPLMPVGLVLNACVHVVMYGYYLSSSLGWRWPSRWKRAVTEAQIWQFVVTFALSVVFLWMHFVGDGCSGFKAWVFNAAFNGSLLGLFLNFHATAYKDKKKRVEEKRE